MVILEPSGWEAAILQSSALGAQCPSAPWVPLCRRAQGSPVLGFCSGPVGFAAVCFLLLPATWSRGGVTRRSQQTSQQDVSQVPGWSWRLPSGWLGPWHCPGSGGPTPAPTPGPRGKLGNTEGILGHPCWLPAGCRTLSRTPGCHSRSLGCSVLPAAFTAIFSCSCLLMHLFAQ